MSAFMLRRGPETPMLGILTMGMFSTGSVLLLISGLVAEESRSPSWLLFSVSGAAAVAAGVAAVLRERFTTVLATIAMLGTTLAIVAMCLATDSAVGVIINGTILILLGMYAAGFLSAMAARTVLGFSLLSYLVVVVKHDLPGTLYAAFAIAVQATIAAEVILRFRRALVKLAQTDPLTGALNRRALSEVAERMLERSRRTERPLSVWMVDLDGFKSINDRLGHAAGDEVLMKLTSHLAEVIGPRDVLARTGGDEFVILLPGRSAEQSAEMAEFASARAPGAWSIGMATAEPGEDLQSLLERADRDLYRRKAARTLQVEPHATRQSGE